MKRFVWLLFACLLISAFPHLLNAKVDFLLPGLGLEGVEFLPGSKVSYLVESTAFGVTDSTLIDISIDSGDERCLLVTVVSSPYPRSDKDAVVVLMRFAPGTRRISDAEHFRSALKEILIKEGENGFRKPTDKEMNDFGIDDLFISRSSRMKKVVGDSVTVSTPAGKFYCYVANYSERKVDLLNLGGVKARKVEEIKTKIWESSVVPIFHLVRSCLERRKSISTGSSAEGDTSGGGDVTITKAYLISFIKR